MSFVSTDDHKILSSFSQSAIRYINVGDPVEMVFRTRPGKVYSGKVIRIARASGTSQVSASSQLPTLTGQPEMGRWAVLIKFDNEEDENQMPQSASASIIAVYTEKGKPVHIISKVVMRMNAWMGYLTSP
jgi:multidrug resistance efflux pump